MRTRQATKPSATPATRQRRGILQPKLRVNRSGNAFEHDADRAAQAVMHAHRADHVPAQAAAPVQRRASGGDPGTLEAPPMVGEVLQSPGQPLPEATRGFMEPRFGHDFSRVRIHTDGKAADSAAAVNALAYTVGSNIVFARGQYAPDTGAGSRLLAHELAHVVQQGPEPRGPSFLQRQTPQPSAAPAPAPATCSAKQRAAIRDAGKLLRKWLDRAANQLNDFAAASQTTHKLGPLLQKHFGTRDLLHAEYIRIRLEAVRDDLIVSNTYLQNSDCPADAPGPAWVTGQSLPVHFGPRFFAMGEPEQAAVLLHELTHVALKQKGIIGTTDIAYKWQRLYGKLEPTDAMDNADSYTEFVKNVITGKTDAFKQEADVLKGCPPAWKSKIADALALAQAWVMRTLNLLGDRRPDFVDLWRRLRIKYLDPKPAALKPGASVEKFSDTADDIDYAEMSFLGAAMTLRGKVNVQCPAERGASCPDNPYSSANKFDDILVLCPAWQDLSKNTQATWALAPFLSGEWLKQWRQAEFAREVYEQHELGRREHLREQLGLTRP